MFSSSNSIGKAISSVVIFTFLAKILGFFRELLLSYYFGATGISDAYLISQTIPGTIFQFVGTGLLTCFIPIYFKVLHNNDDTVLYTNKILNLVFVFSTIVMVLIWLDTPLIVKVFASGFKDDTLYYGIWFTRIGVLSLYFSSMIYVFNSYLQANNIFSATAFAAIPNSLSIMAAIVLGAKVNIWLLSIGSTLAVGIQLLFLLWAIRKTPFCFQFVSPWKDPYIKQFFVLMLPVIIGVSLQEINILVDRTIASQIAIGGISALTYANSLIHFVQGGVVQPVVTVCYPKITKTTQENLAEAKKFLEQTIDLLLGLLIPITFGFILFSRVITEVLFGRGVFDEHAVSLTSTAVCFYATGICFVGIREVVLRYFYANSDTKSPMVNASIGVIVNIIMNITLSRYIGIAGIAIATSVSALFTTLLLLRDCGVKLKGGYIHFNLNHILKILITAIIMCGLSYPTYVVLILEFPKTISLLFAIFVGVVAYAFVGYLLKLQIIIFSIMFIKKVLKIT